MKRGRKGPNALNFSCLLNKHKEYRPFPSRGALYSSTPPFMGMNYLMRAWGCSVFIVQYISLLCWARACAGRKLRKKGPTYRRVQSTITRQTCRKTLALSVRLCLCVVSPPTIRLTNGTVDTDRAPLTPQRRAPHFTRPKGPESASARARAPYVFRFHFPTALANALACVACNLSVQWTLKLKNDRLCSACALLSLLFRFASCGATSESTFFFLHRHEENDLSFRLERDFLPFATRIRVTGIVFSDAWVEHQKLPSPLLALCAIMSSPCAFMEL